MPEDEEEDNFNTKRSQRWLANNASEHLQLERTARYCEKNKRAKLIAGDSDEVSPRYYHLAIKCFFSRIRGSGQNLMKGNKLKIEIRLRRRKKF